MSVNTKDLSHEPVANPDGDPEILAACYAADQVEIVRSFFKETGIAQEACTDINTLLFVTHERGIPLSNVLQAFRKYGVDDWSNQSEHYRGNPFACPRETSVVNCQIFYSVYFELGLLIPAEFATGRIRR